MASAASSALININGVYGSKSFEYGTVKLTPSRCLPSKNAWQRKAKFYGHMSCKQRVSPRAEYGGDSRGGGSKGDFLAGMLLGGAIFGALGYVFAPQISKSLLSFDKSLLTLEEAEEWWLRRKLPKRMYDDKDLEITRKDLNEKIAQLNTAIDEVYTQLKAENGASRSFHGASEKHAAHKTTEDYEQ